jgi:signal transduction histidine kinase
MPIFVDADAVAEAIMNLIGNAIKYSPDNKVLKIVVRRNRDRILCAVQDKGQGISAESIPYLFDRFYRDPGSSTSVRGVGLGLSLVKHIMEEHGGGVDVASAPGKGSTFTVWFPLHPQGGAKKYSQISRM